MNISFKKEKSKPFAYSSIEMRKSSSGKVWWIVGIVLLTLLGGILWLK